MIFSSLRVKEVNNMIVALMFFGYIFGVIGVTGLIMTGIHHIGLYLERKRDEKETPRYEKYQKLFKYNP